MGFDVKGLIMFAIIMIPNIIWSFVPAPNDILKAESVTVLLDSIASVSQVLMILGLCVFINKDNCKLNINPLTISTAICTILYYLCWVLYYTGIVQSVIILGLAVLPCVAFLLFAIDRKNYIAIIPTAIFTVCHIIFAVVNFVV